MRWLGVCTAATAAMFFLTGCGGNSSLSGVNRDTADQLDAVHSHFESAEDPPITAQTRYAAGQFAESQNAPIQAIAQYKEALKLDPKHIPSLYRLGVLCTQVKKYPDAINAWHRYIELAGASATAYSNLGFCCELAGRFHDAENAYQLGIAADPHSRPCQVNYGLMLTRLGRTDEAIKHLSTVLSLAEVHYDLASVYEQQGRTDEAKAEFRKAMEIDPNFSDAQTRLATLK